MPMPVAEGGLVMCGAPTLAAALSEDDELDWEHTCPVGADDFVEHWLDGVAQRAQRVMDAIVALPEVASSGRPSVQKAIHVLRLVEPRYTKAWAAEFDKKVVQAWCAVNHSQELTASQHGLLCAPCRYGGLGF
eukprot:6142453-Karenia_brevis.AAC.1